MLTAAITASVGAVLALFGIEPGAYLIGVAAVVKGLIIAAGVFFGVKLTRRRRSVFGPRPHGATSPSDSAEAPASPPEAAGASESARPPDPPTVR
jgi:hypothetical protein